MTVRPKQCAGGFPSGYQCHNIAGCPHTPLWCFDCNEKRMALISSRLAGLVNPAKRGEK